MAEHTSGRSWPIFLIVGVCTAIISAAVAMVAVGLTDDPVTASDDVVIQSAPRDAPGQPTPSADAAGRPDTPVDPQCWASRKSAEAEWCQIQVRERTRYAARYSTNQASLARTHPVVKLAATGRQANSLARHGLLSCWMIKESSWSLDDARAAFFLWFHRHPFRVPDDNTKAAADNILSIAIQEICPSVAPTFERKGGPKAELIQGLGGGGG